MLISTYFEIQKVWPMAVLFFNVISVINGKK